MSALLVILLNGLWQGAAIAAITWCALRLSPKVNASTRYAAWTLALVATVIVPVVTSLGRISYQPQDEPVAQQQRVSSISTTQHHHERVTRESTVSPAIVLPQAPSVRVAPPALLTDAVFAFWALAAFVLIVRLGVALLQLERLKRDALPLGMQHRETLEQWQQFSGHSRDVRICVTSGIEVPVAVGLFDAMVLLPKHLLDSLESSEIDQISLHELSHLLRHDDWSNAFQRIVTALLFFNPAVWFIARQMDIEREVACDDFVLELTGAVRTYAYCLTKMAEMTSWPHQPLAAPGVFVTRKNISIRIERLLRTGRAISSSISPATAAAVIVGLGAAYLFARVFTPAIAFALPQSIATAAPPVVAVKPTATARAATPAAVATTRPRIFPSPRSVVAQRAVNVALVDVPKVQVHIPPVNVHIPPVTVHIAPIHLEPKSVVASLDAARSGNCTGCSFAGARLDGKDFSGQNLIGSDFENAHLRGANFSGSNLSGTSFEHADLRGVSFDGANLSGVDFDGAKLDGAHFDGANLTGAAVTMSDLSPAQTRTFLLHCNGCDFSKADLEGQDLHGLSITGADLAGANLRNVDLSNANLNGVDLSNADLSGARLNGTMFRGCDFSHTDLRHVDLTHTNFVGSSLGEALMN